MTKNELDAFKTENITLASKLQLFGEDKNRIIDKCQQLEMQLVTAYEKHKICQMEVVELVAYF